jgi:hypothetical protein
VFDGMQQPVHIAVSSPSHFFRARVSIVDSVPTGIHIITVSGTYEMSVLLPTHPGSLVATVYSDAFFIGAVRNELWIIDFSCSNMASYPVSGKEAFSVKWMGFFKPTKTSMCVIFEIFVSHVLCCFAANVLK